MDDDAPVNLVHPSRIVRDGDDEPLLHPPSAAAGNDTEEEQEVQKEQEEQEDPRHRMVITKLLIPRRKQFPRKENLVTLLCPKSPGRTMHQMVLMHLILKILPKTHWVPLVDSVRSVFSWCSVLPDLRHQLLEVFQSKGRSLHASRKHTA